MTSRSVKTDLSLLAFGNGDSCNDWGYDCSPTHDWITIDGTRNDQTLIYYLHYGRLILNRFCPKSTVKIEDRSLVNCRGKISIFSELNRYSSRSFYPESDPGNDFTFYLQTG